MFSAITLILVLVLFKVVYERWVTPLSQVPGQFWYSISELAMRYHMMRGTLPEELLRMHNKYGPIVRVAPQQVSVNDLTMAKQVLGSHTYTKSKAFEMPKGTEPNMFSTRSPKLSIERRKQLGPMHNVQRKIDDMLARSGSSIVVPYYKWFSLIAFDVIGALGFGQSFHALDTEAHELIPLLTQIRVFNNFALAFPWVKHIANLLGPRFTTFVKIKAFSQSAIDSRRADPVPRVDMLQTLLDAGRVDGGKRQPLSDEEMVSETMLHLVAGVDTTVAGMTWTLALLLHNPHILARLVSDIRREFPAGSSHVITYDECR
ncbi:hypothetical protein GGH96_001939 [Coemansia sp. RSA 1972]|nr:hypothetical protein GGH96_001939 [Coemansia sp. RSA 1972]